MMLSGRFHYRHMPLLVVQTRGHQTHETLQFGHEHVALALPLTFISSFATVLNTCTEKCYRTAAQRPGLSVSAMLPAGPLGGKCGYPVLDPSGQICYVFSNT